MKIRVLGASGAEFPGHNPPAYLINNFLLLDAGTLGAVLKEEEQWKIRYILLSHAHLDHIRAIPFLADNIIIKNKRHSITVMATRQVLVQLKRHLLNGSIWPDFTTLGKKGPVLRLRELKPEKEIKIKSLSIIPVPVNHSVPASGFIIKEIKKDRESVLVYTGDTGPTDRLWSYSEGADLLISEVSFPNRLGRLAQETGHLTPSLLKKELKKIKTLPEMILITHPKPQYVGIIQKELRDLKIKGLRLLREGEEIEI
ncbi:MAG: 3',5'-cyclic-nucleotide phosphodiesterase [Thermodesulfovibrionales bacterium]|nr:3',5'-cyclic-nucleotide phosphodiesterase [Thermodesulfovibrionales bacterium]